MRMQCNDLTIRQAGMADAKQLATWWNDGAVMVHAGFPNGLGTTEEEVIEGLENGRMVIAESDRLIGECVYRNVADGVAEIGIKICETDCQNRGIGRKVLSMLIGCSKTAIPKSSSIPTLPTQEHSTSMNPLASEK